tara:strand:+ start:78 stop:404 length:327 start_codon:yes stop_codon:yes gene_type:complete
MMNVWQKDLPQQLSLTLASIADEKTMQLFLTDVLTQKEIIEISSRLEAALMLQAGEKYEDIIRKTRLSTRTVARIREWLKNGSGGYRIVFEAANCKEHSQHMSPADAE